MSAHEREQLRERGERRRALVSERDIVTVVTETVPQPARGEALVEMSVAGICGSDKAGLHGEHAFMKPPYYPGHEVVGVVVGLGDHAAGVSVGDRVTVEPTLPCGQCKPCRNGAENLCEHLEFFGCGYREGGMADVFTVPAGRLVKVPPELTDYEAALIEPLATPLHAVRLAGDMSGRAVAILGAGTIGLLTLAAVRRAGARRVVSTDMVPHKREMALFMGADAVVDGADEDLVGSVRAALGESGDVIFDCVATEKTVGQAIRIAIKGGTVVVVGGARRPVTIDLPVVQEYQVRVQGSTTYLRDDLEQAIEVLKSPGFDASVFVTATFPLGRAGDAFAAIDTGEQVKILVTASDEGDHAGGSA